MRSLAHCLTPLAFLLLFFPLMTEAGHARVAVASNFSVAIKQLQQAFEASSEHQLSLIFSSTGKLYAQIKYGAPFDIFFSADVKRPKLLEEEGLIVESSRFSYALGKLVLWSPDKDLIQSGVEVLGKQDFTHIAVANPKLAPYGRAAKEALQALGYWQQLQPKMVRGESIGQALQFVRSGNAKLGFVAYSQIAQHSKGSYWDIPDSLYSPIVQQAVLLKEKPAAVAFIDFMHSKEAQELLLKNGYSIAKPD